MPDRNISFVDRLLIEADSALRTVAAPPRAAEPRPDRDTRNAAPGRAGTAAPADSQPGDVSTAGRTDGPNPPDEPMNAAAKRLSAALMRVNHSGEIAAQALYRGQALVARDPALRRELLQSAAEEYDHLAWCRSRTEELGGRTSLLAPFWYAGSFAIGMAAGLSGDRTSLGFLDETEKQVAEHLNGHLKRLPADDVASRRIVERMRADELRHGKKARDLGGTALPKPVRRGMRLLSRVMTGLSFRL